MAQVKEKMLFLHFFMEPEQQGALNMISSFDECWRNLDTVVLRDGYVPRAQFNLPPTQSFFLTMLSFL